MKWGKVQGAIRLAASRRQALLQSLAALEDSARTLAKRAGTTDMHSLYQSALLGPYQRARVELLKGVRGEERLLVAMVDSLRLQDVTVHSLGRLRTALVFAAFPPGKAITRRAALLAMGTLDRQQVAARLRTQSAYYHSHWRRYVTVRGEVATAAAERRVVLVCAMNLATLLAGKAPNYAPVLCKVSAKQARTLEQLQAIMDSPHATENQKREARRSYRKLTDPVYAHAHRVRMGAWLKGKGLGRHSPLAQEQRRKMLAKKRLSAERITEALTIAHSVEGAAKMLGRTTMGLRTSMRRYAMHVPYRRDNKAQAAKAQHMDRTVEALRNGMSYTAAAHILGVSVSTIQHRAKAWAIPLPFIPSRGRPAKGHAPI